MKFKLTPDLFPLLIQIVDDSLSLEQTPILLISPHSENVIMFVSRQIVERLAQLFGAKERFLCDFLLITGNDSWYLSQKELIGEELNSLVNDMLQKQVRLYYVNGINPHSFDYELM
ncbi:hypothetical protein [Alicyclobacillus sendaiensis]|uniref:hypothetical protein n=1 Tax=Alicyclobacillus sendaiensis TaxID=192387 RepID=UPI0026F414D7|nr:hypothetical protein [Alicyclobacillus sendaiensis]